MGVRLMVLRARRRQRRPLWRLHRQKTLRPRHPTPTHQCPQATTPIVKYVSPPSSTGWGWAARRAGTAAVREAYQKEKKKARGGVRRRILRLRVGSSSNSIRTHCRRSRMERDTSIISNSSSSSNTQRIMMVSKAMDRRAPRRLRPQAKHSSSSSRTTKTTHMALGAALVAWSCKKTRMRRQAGRQAGRQAATTISTAS